MHVAQLSVLPNQLYFIPAEISGNLNNQEKKGEKRKFYKTTLL